LSALGCQRSDLLQGHALALELLRHRFIAPKDAKEEMFRADVRMVQVVRFVPIVLTQRLTRAASPLCGVLASPRGEHDLVRAMRFQARWRHLVRRTGCGELILCSARTESHQAAGSGGLQVTCACNRPSFERELKPESCTGDTSRTRSAMPPGDIRAMASVASRQEIDGAGMSVHRVEDGTRSV